jgi:hypothetical protein
MHGILLLYTQLQGQDMSSCIWVQYQFDVLYSEFAISRHPIININRIGDNTNGVLINVPTVPPIVPATKLLVSSPLFVVAFGKRARTE